MATCLKVLTDRGATLAALIAVIAGVPSLLLPFLSDDWVHVVAANEGQLVQTPFGFFRPLCNLSYWIDWQIWGLTPAAFHVTNLALTAITAALVVILVRRYTGDRFLAGFAGILFALHPYHIGPVAWTSARSDLLSALIVLLAVWAYDRWRERLSGFPIAALALYQLAMLAKESAVVLPALLIVIGLFDRRRRASVSEWLRGYLPLLALGLVHFIFVRAGALGGISLNHLKWIGAWRGNLFSYGATAIVPPPPEIFQARPLTWGTLAALVTGFLLLVAHKRTGRIPRVVWPAAAAFVVLLGPSLIGFNNRYFFLPSAVSALALAALLRSAGTRIGGLVGCLLLCGWLATSIEQWTGQFEASRASTRLMSGLVQAAQTDEERTIVAVAPPHRVHGVPVTTEYSTVVSFLVGREIAVRTATEFDYPSSQADAFAVPHESAFRQSGNQAIRQSGNQAIRQSGNEIVFRLSVELKPYSRLVLPLFIEGESRGNVEGATITRAGLNTALVRIPMNSETRIYVWVNGALLPALDLL